MACLYAEVSCLAARRWVAEGPRGWQKANWGQSANGVQSAIWKRRRAAVRHVRKICICYRLAARAKAFDTQGMLTVLNGSLVRKTVSHNFERDAPKRCICMLKISSPMSSRCNLSLG